MPSPTQLGACRLWLTPRRRLAVWAALVAAILVLQPAWLVATVSATPSSVEAWRLFGQAGIGMLVIGLFALMRTTPPNAIRLPRPTSELIIAAGVIGLQSAALIAVRVFAPGWGTVAIESGVTTQADAATSILSAGPSMSAAIVAVVATLALLLVLRSTGGSAWMATLFGWNPLLAMATLNAGEVRLMDSADAACRLLPTAIAGVPSAWIGVCLAAVVAGLCLSLRASVARSLYAILLVLAILVPELGPWRFALPLACVPLLQTGGLAALLGSAICVASHAPGSSSGHQASGAWSAMLCLFVVAAAVWDIPRTARRQGNDAPR